MCMYISELKVHIADYSIPSEATRRAAAACVQGTAAVRKASSILFYIRRRAREASVQQSMRPPSLSASEARFYMRSTTVRRGGCSGFIRKSQSGNSPRLCTTENEKILYYRSSVYTCIYACAQSYSSLRASFIPIREHSSYYRPMRARIKHLGARGMRYIFFYFFFSIWFLAQDKWTRGADAEISACFFLHRWNFLFFIFLYEASVKFR